MPGYIELTDDVIVLKPFRMEDAEPHLQGEDVEMQKWLSGGKSTIDSVRRFIKKRQQYWQAGGPVFCFSIWTVQECKIIGMIEANTDNKIVEGIEKGDANISYGLYPDFRGKGYMARAISLMQDFLKTKGLKQAVIRVSPENINSLRVTTRCGFKRTGQVVTKREGILLTFIKKLQYYRYKQDH